MVNTIFDVLTQSRAEFPNCPLIMTTKKLADIWCLKKNVFTYSDVIEIVSSLRDNYATAGFGNGHRIALLMENRPDFFFHFLALNSLGCSIVPINPDYKYEEIKYLLDHSESEIIISIRERIEELKRISEKAYKQPPVIDFEKITDQLQKPKTAVNPDVPNVKNEAALLYTSGTTGRPKGCIITNEYFFGWGEWYLNEGGHVSLQKGTERILQPLPTFHTNALGHSFMGMLFSGGCQIILDRFHPRTWWSDAIETGATAFHYLGVMPAMLLNLPPCDEEKNHNMRFGLGGGIDPAYHEIFEKRFGCPLLEGWAMTETGGAGTIISSSEPRHVGTRCIGRPGEDIEVCIIDEEGDPVTLDEPGELLIRRKGADFKRGYFSGYLKDEKATEEAWAGGWLHTGDILRQGKDGSLYFIDRKKNIIRRSGENIASAEVELILRKHSVVADIAIVAVADEIREEEVMAYIKLKPGIAPNLSTASDIFNWSYERMAYYKAPGYITFVDSLPTTSTQKIKKAALKQQFSPDILSSDLCFDFRKKKKKIRNWSK